MRAARESAEESWLTRWFTSELDQLATLQALVDGKRRRGSTASGLLCSCGLDAAGWDWSRGFAPGWPSSLKDRLRSYLPVHPA